MKFNILHILILIGGLSFLMTSCHKENITNTTETEVENPKTIDYPFFTGRVVDDFGKTQADIEVEIYQDGNLVGTVSTDKDGRYSTHKHKLAFKSPVTLYPKKEGLFSVLRRSKEVEETENKLDLRLMSLEGATITPKSEVYPGDTSLIKISGEIFTTSGNPAVADVFVGHEIVNISPTSWYAKGEFTMTDENGYYELYLPKDKELFFFAWEKHCGSTFLNTVTDFDKSPFEELGLTSEDRVLETLNNAIHETFIDRTVSATIKDCTGNPIADTEYYVRWRSENSYRSIKANTDANGLLEIPFIVCDNEINYEVLSSVPGFENAVIHKSSSEDNSVDLGDVIDCNQTVNISDIIISKMLCNDKLRFGSGKVVCKITQETDYTSYDIESFYINLADKITGSFSFHQDANGSIEVQSLEVLPENCTTTFSQNHIESISYDKEERKGEVKLNHESDGNTLELKFSLK